MNLKRVVFGGLIATGIIGASVSSALAWGCKAQAGGMSTIYGYSKGYSTRGEAEGRALAECQKNGGKGCKITYCTASD